MKNLTTLLLVTLAVLSLAACSDDEVKSKNWYIAHSEEQAIKHAICVQRPEMVKEPNCINASKAEKILSQDFETIQAYIKEHGLNNSIK